MSTRAIQVTGGVKRQDESKNHFKSIFPEKGRPVLNTVQKRPEQSSIFLSTEIWPQLDNKVTQQQPWKNEGCQMSYVKNKSKKTRRWRYFKLVSAQLTLLA